MKKLIVLLLPLFLFPLGVSASVIFNYQSIADHAGDPNHKGEAILEGVPITVSGLTVTAYGSYDGDDDRGWAYLDKSDAGLGVCHQPLGNCASHWDDNLTDNEVLQLVFSESVSLDSLLLQRGNHHGFNERFRLSLNGTDYTQYEYLSDSY
ncbi:MAG: hypothetical protein GY694_03370, partial [Gammaproteobacteria bacterium]|nr:hypothetical protein [Gammaproteobacteria bacterium]